MIIEIDQSGKIEKTRNDTVIAFVDNKDFKRSLRISAREKRKLQKFFRDIGRPRFFAYKVFAVLIFILTQEYLSRIDRIVIDPEYPGHEVLIRDLLIQLIKPVNRKFERNQITFKRVGKQSLVHDLAWKVFRRKLKPTKTVTAKDVLNIIVN